MLNLKTQKNQTAARINDGLNVVLGTTACLNQVVLFSAGHHVYSGILLQILGIVGQLVELTIENSTNTADKKIQIRRAHKSHDEY